MISDLEVLVTIEERFKKEGIHFKKPYFDTGCGPTSNGSLVAATSELSPQGNSIDFEVYAFNLKQEDLERKTETSSGVFLISEAMKQHFKFYVTRGLPGESPDIGNEPAIGEILEVVIKDGLVLKVKSELKPEYLQRLRVNEPLEKALDLILESYRTKYEMVSQVAQIPNS